MTSLARLWNAIDGGSFTLLKAMGAFHKRGLQPGWLALPDRLVGQHCASVGRQDGCGASRPQKPYDPVRSVAFSADGERILTGSDDKTARLWDAKTGAEIYALKGHTDPVTSVAFSPDGARILTGSDDNTARLWDHRQGQVLIEEDSEAMPRCLTADQRRAFQLTSSHLSGATPPKNGLMTMSL